MNVSEDYTEHQVAARCHVSRRTLATWRSQKKGPAYRRFGNIVLYPAQAFEVWLASTVNYTRDVPPPAEPPILTAEGANLQ